MRILLGGAGGVGSAFCAIATRRDFFEQIVVCDYDAARAKQAAERRRRSTVLSRSGRRDVGRRGGRTGSAAPDYACHERRGPPVCDADLHRRTGRRRRLSRHGDEPLAAPPRAPVQPDRRQARRRAVRRRGTVAHRRAAGARRHRGGTRAVRRVRPACRRPPVLRHRRTRHPRRLQPDRGGLRFRAVVLHLDDDRGVPEPARGLGGRPWLVCHRTIQRARGFRLP